MSRPANAREPNRKPRPPRAIRPLPPNPSHRVALLIESSRSYGRLLLTGVNRYLQTHRRWLIHFEPGNGDLARGFDQWDGDGVIVRCRSQEVADAVGRRNIPKIMFGPYLPRRERGAKIRRDLGSNHYAEGAMAAQHLRQCGLRNFAFYVTEYRSPSERERGFVETIESMGLTCAVYRDSRRVGQSDQDAVVNEQALAPWLLSLPKPLGIMAHNDDYSRHIAQACLSASLSVPDDVAIIGADNDELICTMANPPLSSVAPPYEQMGYLAAAMLDRLMAGENVPMQHATMDPLGVVARHSTNVLSVDDPLVAEALAYLSSHISRPINVRDLMDHLLVSRRNLERRFSAAVGRTPAQEITRLRVDRAIVLLQTTDLRISDICDQTGFSCSARLSEAFTRLLGTSPAAYRKVAKRQFRVH